MRALIATAPNELRNERRDLNVHRLLERTAAYRHSRRRDVHATTKFALRTLARRAIALEAEITELDQLLTELVAINGVGTDVAIALLVAAGDNPERLRTEATFAHLCGVAPIDASSGKQERHRLKRDGDRQANSPLWHSVITRMVCDQRTRDYIARRIEEGRTKKEAMRCLKRYIAREIYHQLPRQELIT